MSWAGIDWLASNYFDYGLTVYMTVSYEQFLIWELKPMLQYECVFVLAHNDLDCCWPFVLIA